MYKVVIKKKAQKQFDRLPTKDQKRVLVALQSLRKDPYNGKKLEGELALFWSMRVWPYRIIYMIEKKIVTVSVVAIGDRKNVYKKLM
ncbi:type II toxin-antitoxin system RelE/ParE family toxin [Patescibacteria group bacterium]|nr:type II toxin-antitoxin system RelE/ParE family toxin [Patescibacteria group bacterium]MBU2259154.1 type II toxin-antitoxin system RelE/ParE family toxin [Patescibacteria group bacterium]